MKKSQQLFDDTTYPTEPRERRIQLFTAERPTQLFGRRYSKGDSVRLVYVEDVPEEWWLEDHMGKGGPWGWGGYSGRDIRRAYRPLDDDY